MIIHSSWSLLFLSPFLSFFPLHSHMTNGLFVVFFFLFFVGGDRRSVIVHTAPFFSFSFSSLYHHRSLSVDGTLAQIVHLCLHLQSVVVLISHTHHPIHYAACPNMISPSLPPTYPRFTLTLGRWWWHTQMAVLCTSPQRHFVIHFVFFFSYGTHIFGLFVHRISPYTLRWLFLLSKKELF